MSNAEEVVRLEKRVKELEDTIMGAGEQSDDIGIWCPFCDAWCDLTEELQHEPDCIKANLEAK